MFTAAMTFDLGEDVNACATWYRWAQDQVCPLADEVDRDNVFPAALWRDGRTWPAGNHRARGIRRRVRYLAHVTRWRRSQRAWPRFHCPGRIPTSREPDR